LSSADKIEFYLLDITYEVRGNEPHIIIWAALRDGRRALLRDRRFRPYFYAILSDEVDPKSIILR